MRNSLESLHVVNGLRTVDVVPMARLRAPSLCSGAGPPSAALAQRGPPPPDSVGAPGRHTIGSGPRKGGAPSAGFPQSAVRGSTSLSSTWETDRGAWPRRAPHHSELLPVGKVNPSQCTSHTHESRNSGCRPVDFATLLMFNHAK
jgi:hypothetical protein